MNRNEECFTLYQKKLQALNECDYNNKTCYNWKNREYVLVVQEIKEEIEKRGYIRIEQ